jgi:hypothetical protein
MPAQPGALNPSAALADLFHVRLILPAAKECTIDNTRNSSYNCQYDKYDMDNGPISLYQ